LYQGPVVCVGLTNMVLQEVSTQTDVETVPGHDHSAWLMPEAGLQTIQVVCLADLKQQVGAEVFVKQRFGFFVGATTPKAEDNLLSKDFGANPGMELQMDLAEASKSMRLPVKLPLARLLSPEGEGKLRKRVQRTMLCTAPMIPKPCPQNLFAKKLDLEPAKVGMLTEGKSSSFLGSDSNAALFFGCSMAQEAPLNCERSVLPEPNRSGSVQKQNNEANMEPHAEQNPSKIGLPLKMRHHSDPFTMFEPACDPLSGGLELDLHDSKSSLGSALHAMGTCQPCAWFWKPGGCQNGKDCLRCHSCPEGEVKLRQKVKRNLMRNGHMLLSLQAPIPTSMLRKSASAKRTPSVASARLTNVENEKPNNPQWTAAALSAQQLSSSEAFESGKIDPLPGAPTAPTGFDEEGLEVSVRQMGYPQERWFVAA